jgi:endoglucanase
MARAFPPAVGGSCKRFQRGDDIVIESRTSRPTSRAAVRTATVLAACWLTGTVALAQPTPPKSAVVTEKPQPGLRLNDKEYFEARGLNVLVFTNQYNGMFFDEKTAGVEIIHHGVRISTGGAVRLSPTPEQWDQIPKLVDRKLDKAANTITCTLRYDAFDFDTRLVVTPEGSAFRIAVYADKPVPEKLEGRAGFNLEFLPSRFFEKTYLADGRPGIFPRSPIGPTEIRPGDTKIVQYEGYTTFDDRGRNEYPEARPVATGRTFVFAPEDPDRRVTIKALSGDLQLLDGRNLSQNGWFIVRSLLATKATGKVAEWVVSPNVVPNWTRTPVVGFSQVGYHPTQKKVAVIELDANDTALPTASLFEVTPEGTPVERLKVAVKPWGPYLRYKYATADFSAANRPGLYYIQYGKQKTEVFPVAPNVYDTIWHATSDVWFPVQMDHMAVNEAYRVWHGLTHMDDALQAPLNFQQFDGYRMGASTDTKYKPLERIPGLAVGGWFDAGDFDIQGGSHASTLTTFVDIWETFKPQRDQTFIDQATRFVDIHRPDGKPDFLQQIEHGALQIAAQYRSIGQLNQGVVDQKLHTYHHLGDASTQTDNLLYDPSLKPYQVEGNRSGTMDDRFVFTTHQPFLTYSGIGSLAAASRALRGFNDALAGECLALAKKAYAEERQRPATTPPRGGPGGGFGAGADLTAALQLARATGEQQYVDRVNELIWPALGQPGGRSLLSAVRALSLLGPGAVEKLRPYVLKYKATIDDLAKANPYGVPIATGGWAGSGNVVNWASTNYQLHKLYPDIIDAESVYRGLSYIFGTHPASNTSLVATVGTKSKRLAYGTTRADFTFIPGVIVPGVMILKPDFPENMDDWPFLWGENEGTITGAVDYLFLSLAAGEMVKK